MSPIGSTSGINALMYWCIYTFLNGCIGALMHYYNNA